MVEIVQFLRWPFAARQLEQVFLRGGALLQPHHLALARPIVDVAKRADSEIQFGIARRPAVGPQIADVQEILGANRPGGITEIALAHIGVALAFDEYSIAALVVRIAE